MHATVQPRARLIEVFPSPPSNTALQIMAARMVLPMQEFRKGDLVDRRREDLPIYSLYGPLAEMILSH